jgi:hypothetical protein
MARWQDMNGSMPRTRRSDIARNISSAEEKVDILKSERSMEEDLSMLSIRSVSSAVGPARVTTSSRHHVPENTANGVVRQLITLYDPKQKDGNECPEGSSERILAKPSHSRAGVILEIQSFSRFDKDPRLLLWHMRWKTARPS